LGSGLILIGFKGVVDTRTQAVHRFDRPGETRECGEMNPLGLSPDERSFIRFAYGSTTQDDPVLIVTDFVANRADVLPIDRSRMRYTKIDQIDFAWILHHFQWQCEIGGPSKLVARSDFPILPYRGDIDVDWNGRQQYHLGSVKKEIRQALEELLISQFKAQRQPAISSNDYEHNFLIDGKGVAVAASDDGHYLSITLDKENPADLITKIAGRVDAELATGKLDAFFV
jgi:hypothetical protein